MVIINVMRDPQSYIKQDEIQRLFNIEYAGSLRNICLLRLLYYGGRRISEVLCLKVKDIIFDEGMIIFSILKKRGQIKRMKRIDNNTLLLLRQYIQEDNLKPYSDLFKIKRVQAWNIIKNTARNSGVKMANGNLPSPHSLRHSFAVHFMKSSGDIRKLQMLLEHSNPNTTMGYLQYSKKELSDEYDRIFQN